MQNFQVCCVQPFIGESLQDSFTRIEGLLSQAKQQQPSLVVLPERWLPFRFSANMSEYVFEANSEPLQFLQRCAEKYSLNIISGGLWEYSSNQPKIVCYFIDASGHIIGRQEKLHLYALEQHFFKPGDTLCLFQMEELIFAILICFDISFYETPALAVNEGADLLISPTLIRREGMDNWQTYLRARALENRVPVIACNSVGEIAGSEYLGCSQIIQFYPGHRTPSKLKISTAPENKESLLVDRVDYKFPRRLRTERLSERIDVRNLKILRAKKVD